MRLKFENPAQYGTLSKTIQANNAYLYGIIKGEVNGTFESGKIHAMKILHNEKWVLLVLREGYIRFFKTFTGKNVKKIDLIFSNICQELKS